MADSDPISTPSSGRRVLVTGSLAFDQIMNFPGKFQDHILPDKLHMINISFLVEERRIQRGGCAANIAYGLSLLGEQAAVVAAAGHDFGGYRAYLEDLGVDVSGIRVFDDLPTAACFIPTDRADNHITGFHPGAMARARELSVEAAVTAGETKPAFAVVAPDDPEAIVRHCREAKRAGVPLVFDPSFQVVALDGDALRDAARGARVVLVNDYEYAIIQDKTGFGEADLLDLAPIWVVTLGEKGSRIAVTGGETIDVPACPAREVVDPTGAGDAYRAGFVAGLLRGLDLEVCGRMGSVSAVYAVESYGTQAHRFTRDEFAARYHEAFG
ncbi:MAG TPA: carbohydrate kinase family protein [Thermoanaerobaculia bacterium]|nr:carbohydrate kinase family protein [Thermoanaerobaculia bacterium]